MPTLDHLTTNQSGQCPWVDNTPYKPSSLILSWKNFPWKPLGSLGLLSTGYLTSLLGTCKNTALSFSTNQCQWMALLPMGIWTQVWFSNNFTSHYSFWKYFQYYLCSLVVKIPWVQLQHPWFGWMASPTWWTWVWASSGSWWWTGKPGVLQSMGSQRVGHAWATELNYVTLL